VDPAATALRYDGRHVGVQGLHQKTEISERCPEVEGVSSEGQNKHQRRSKLAGKCGKEGSVGKCFIKCKQIPVKRRVPSRRKKKRRRDSDAST